MKRLLTVLLIEDSPEFAELVQRWLAPKPNVEFALNWTDTLVAGLTRLEKGGIDVVLLDLGLPDCADGDTFARVQEHNATVPVIILSAGDTESLALQMVQRGAEDYIVKGECNAEVLSKALRYAVERCTRKVVARIPTRQGRVIGVLGAHGGAGATTFACNLALELRRQTSQGCLLADMQMDAGLVGFIMNAESQYSILDAAANIHRLDRSFWNGMVGHGPEGLHFLRSPQLFGTDPGHVRDVHRAIAIVQTFYDWTVLDLGRLTSSSLAVLTELTELYLVTMTSVPALYEAKRTAGALTKAGIETSSLRLVVNQITAKDEFSKVELSQLFGVPVYAKFPNATNDLAYACAEGRILAGNSEYQRQMAVIARETAGLPEEKAESKVAQLRSLAGKFRRSKATAAGASL